MVNPSSAWTAGAMISTVDDVARFYRALLTERLLPPAQQRELLATIPVDDSGELFAEHYGLGIYSVQLSCGTAWGHDGGWPGGFKTIAYTSRDGSRQAVMVYNDFKMSEPPPAGTGTAAFQRDEKKALGNRVLRRAVSVVAAVTRASPGQARPDPGRAGFRTRIRHGRPSGSAGRNNLPPARLGSSPLLAKPACERTSLPLSAAHVPTRISGTYASGYLAA